MFEFWTSHSGLVFRIPGERMLNGIASDRALRYASV